MTTDVLDTTEAQPKTTTRLALLQETLEAGLNIVGQAVATRPTLPVLSHVLLQVQEGKLTMAATDLELFIAAGVAAKSLADDGAMTVPARLFTDLVKSLPAERADLLLEDSMLHLTCGPTEANIHGLDAWEFPSLPVLDAKEPVTIIDPGTLRQAINQVIIACADEETRPTLTGMFFRFEEDTLTLVSADGFRLAFRTVALPSPVCEPISLIIPASALRSLSKLLAEEEIDVFMYASTGAEGTDTRLVRFQLGAKAGSNEGKITGIDLISVLIDGAFPNYRAIIPAGCTTRVTLGTAELIRAVRTSRLFASIEANILHLEVGEDSLTLTATSKEMGESVIELDAQVEGPALTIAFNASFMLDALMALDADRVTIQLNGSSSPGLIRPSDTTDRLHVIMPMAPH
jgi:DNA polymerase-3 subunit beta